MTENEGLEGVPEAEAVPKRPGRVSVVWIVPILAAVIALGIAVQRILSEGPTATIVFRSAEGLEAGKTKVRYNGVDVGTITAVKLAPDRRGVIATAKFSADAAGLVVEDTTFWVVRPRITGGSVSGLGTLVSGSYVGMDAGKSGEKRRQFNGLSVPPVVTGDLAGRFLTLRADNLGSLDFGTPLYFRRLNVGQVAGFELDPDGRALTVKVFVAAPYDKYVNSATRFWQASGIDLSLGANGLAVQTQSLVSILIGGIAFETPEGDAAPAAADAKFTLFADRAAAFRIQEEAVGRAVLHFGESLRGLSAGSPVTYLGLPVGEVTAVGLDLNPRTLDVTGRVEVALYRERFISTLPGGEQEAAVRAGGADHRVLRNLIEKRRVRAQLRSGNLLTGQMYVAFEHFPNLPRVKVDWSRNPPELPVAPSGMADIQSKVSAILAKLERMPLDEIGQEVRKALGSFDRTMGDAGRLVAHADAELVPEARDAVRDLRRALAVAEKAIAGTEATLVGPDAPGQQELRDALRELAAAARSVRLLVDYLERHPEALIRGKVREKP